jgi:hydroxylysine kinase
MAGTERYGHVSGAVKAELIDGGALCADPPKAGEREAERLLIELFAIAGQVTALSSERDQNFHVRAEDASEYVLKIANAAEPELTTEFQTAALLHIAIQDPELPVQRVIRSRDDRAITRVAINTDLSAVRLMTYLPGQPQFKTTRSRRQQISVAQLLARLDLALVGFNHPGADHDLIWDITHTPRIRALIEQMADPQQRAMAIRVLDNFDCRVAPVLPSMRKQVIHNDMNPHNVLVSDNDAVEISGVLDFGDMVRAPLINELAIAAAYVDFTSEEAIGTVADMAAAYNAIMPLSASELSILPDLIAARQVMTAAITEWRAQRYPDNRSYILRNNPSAWTGLAALARADRNRMTDGILQTCGVTARLNG